MPRLGSSLEGRDEGRRRGPSLVGRRGGAGGGRGDDNDGDHRAGWDSNHDDDDTDGGGERDRLLVVGSAEEAGRPPTRGRVHGAYEEARCGPLPSSSAKPVALLGALVVLVLIVRNATVHDYRGELIDRLRTGGTTQEEIDRLFPKTLAERKQKALDDHSLLESLHGAVAALRVEVDEIKERLAAAEPSAALAAATANAAGGKQQQQQQPREPTPP